MSRIDYKNILTFRFVFEALNRDLKLLFFSNLTGAFGEGLYFYILPLHMEDLGASSVEVGILFSALGLATATSPRRFLSGQVRSEKSYNSRLAHMVAHPNHSFVSGKLESTVIWRDPVWLLDRSTSFQCLHCHCSRKRQDDVGVYYDLSFMVTWIHLLSRLRRLSFNTYRHEMRLLAILRFLCSLHIRSLLYQRSTRNKKVFPDFYRYFIPQKENCHLGNLLRSDNVCRNLS